jgi:hypothetical protein
MATTTQLFLSPGGVARSATDDVGFHPRKRTKGRDVSVTYQ